MKSRLDRERVTIQAMISLFCSDHHEGSSGSDFSPCSECVDLYTYAMKRLDSCLYLQASAGRQKPVCRSCPTHCYRPAMRERISEVMRHSGPRMVLRHPVMAIGHFWDGLRPPAQPGQSGQD